MVYGSTWARRSGWPNSSGGSPSVRRKYARVVRVRARRASAALNNHFGLAAVTDISVFQRRRSALARSMGNGVAVVPTAPERTRNRDAHYPYRFDSYFYYLTGFREPEAVLVILAGSEPKSVLFCRDKGPERESWDGFRYGPEGGRTAFGLEGAGSGARLDER